ncbi:hypothetical protein [Streptomyces sp. NPDC039028]|uniref:hypothetical protein n=1 Tax=unclassified Streptomyces TaxID=2593676 RepID=UPI0033DD01E9
MITTVEQTIEVDVPLGAAPEVVDRRPDERVAWRTVAGGDTPVRPTPQEAKEAWPLPPPPDDRL